MRFHNCAVYNFGSYKTFSINFNNLGLTLLHGATGSGKSTIPDMPAWVLFGQTAKGGTVDNIRNWQANNEVTSGSLEVETSSGQIEVYRVRGSSSQNDLYWIGDNGEQVRGKDVKETQALLNERLGMDYDSYVTSAYFHEFNPVSSFFIAKSTDRRELFEKLTNLTLPKKIIERASNGIRTVENLYESTTTENIRLSGRRDQLLNSVEDMNLRIRTFEERQRKIIEELESKEHLFEETKEERLEMLKKMRDDLAYSASPLEPQIEQERELIDQINALSDEVCNECGSLTNSARRLTLEIKLSQVRKEITLNDGLIKEVDTVNKRIVELNSTVNFYAAQLEKERVRTNEFEEEVKRLKQRLAIYDEELVIIATKLNKFKKEISNFEHLIDLSRDLYALLLKYAIDLVQEETNRYLKTYFDSEIKVSFSMKDSDKLDVQIQKNGYNCFYKQLSKGQRSLLTLCFVASVMAASANKSGIHYDNLFFDEALDGLDAKFKVQAFSMFQELAYRHKSIIIIDHATEFQELFDKRYHVKLIGDISHIEESA